MKQPDASQRAAPSASPCGRCAARLGRSCCEAKDNEALATLTLADVERIQAATHRARDSFVQQEAFQEAEARAYEQLRPGWRGYFRRGPVRLTLARAQGACVFFERSVGCTLPGQVRPTACLLYPFEPTEKGGWTLAVEKEGSVALALASGEPRCLAVEEAAGRRALLRAFGLTAVSLQTLGHRLRAEVHAHGAGNGSPGRRSA
ncbi:MAG: YkgJ family cysteine cluster protein [Myxococcaceae bacterium]